MTNERKQVPSFGTIERNTRIAGDEDLHGVDRYVEVARGMFNERNFDTMTGLLNRDAFEKHVNSFIESHPDEAFALVFIDLDKFKEINTRYGHAGADEILRLVGRGIGAAFNREDEATSRIYGDEFAVLIPKDCDNEEVPSDLRIRGEGNEDRLRDYIVETIARSTFEQLKDDELSEQELEKVKKKLHEALKLSVGIDIMSTTDSKGEPLSKLLMRANERMFRDKHREKPPVVLG
ncbi:GGDEF domain-containing protein [Candidatus Saccharibacteria bacterium]|nr:GGDEF domain-containing protein [Candidatus Saccharibacteria bacterium]